MSVQLAAAAFPLFEQIREVLERSAAFVSALPEPISKGYSLDALFDQVNQPFAVFICGEFNSGKSSLINLLAGEEIARVGVLPTTNEIQSYAPNSLRGLLVIDSPGTNSIIEGHQEKSERFVERADFIVFVTSVDRPLSHSEIQFLELVKNRWHRKTIVVVNKCDLINPTELEQVMQYVKNGCAQILGEVPPLFAVSTRNKEGFEQLQQYLVTELSDAERVRLKLTSPLHSLKVHFQEIEAELKKSEAECYHELQIIQKIVERAERRVAESVLIFDAFRERTLRHFQDLAQRLSQAIDENLGLYQIVRAKLSSKPQKISQVVAGIVHELKVAEGLKTVVNDAATKVAAYRGMIFSDIREFLEDQRHSLSEQVKLVQVRPDVVDVQVISEQLQAAAEKGMTRFLAYGSAAAASGVGAKLAAAVTFEVTGIVLMLTLAIFSMRALPRERRKAKTEIAEGFLDLGRGFSAALEESIRSYLLQAVRELTSKFEQRQITFKEQLATIQLQLKDLELLQQKVDSLLTAAKS